MSHPYLPAVIDLVRQAGRATLPFWRCATAVTAKADDSPVTAADLAAHHLLLGEADFKRHFVVRPERYRDEEGKSQPPACWSTRCPARYRRPPQMAGASTWLRGAPANRIATRGTRTGRPQLMPWEVCDATHRNGPGPVRAQPDTAAYRLRQGR